MQDEPNCCLDALQTAALWLHASGMQEGLKPISEVEGETKKETDGTERNNYVICSQTETMKNSQQELLSLSLSNHAQLVGGGGGPQVDP